VIGRDERNDIINEIATNSKFNGALLRSYTGTLYANQLNFNKTISLICKEIFMMFPVVIYCQKNYFLTEAIDEKIEILQAAGLIDYWHSEIIDTRFMKIEESKQPKGIKFESISGCFYIWIISCTASFLTFFGEVFMGKLLKKKGKFH
jgi:hypothetical protein